MGDIEINLGNPEFNRIKKIIDELKQSKAVEKEIFELINGLKQHPISLDGMSTNEADEMGNLMSVLMSELHRHGWEPLADELIANFHEANPARKSFTVEATEAVEETRPGIEKNF